MATRNASPAKANLVKAVHHPSIEQSAAHSLRNECSYKGLYEEWMRGESYSGHGALLSVVFEDAERTAMPFFDALNVAKGPGFGTVSEWEHG